MISKQDMQVLIWELCGRFIQPVITILVYWFVFSVGFRSGTGDLGVPFVLYLVAGIVPWFFFPGCADRGDKFSAGIQLSGKKSRF